MGREAPDERLVDRARRGDADAFSVLYECLAPRLLRFLYHQVGDPDIAEELMQRTFVKVIEGLPRFECRGGIPFGAWAFRIARNLAIDEHRTAHPALDLETLPEVPSDAPGPEQIVEAGIRRDELLGALEHLPADQHDVIVYRFFAGLSPHEVAPLLHRSDGAVRVLQHRALRHLRELMAPVRASAEPARAGS
jgi:RNA polymerase sigma-70 factor (ECF subfamily)